MPITPDQRAEIDRQRAVSSETRRATVPALEEILYEPIEVLDHGFVRVIDYMGDDSAVVQAARVSYGKGTKKVSEDAGLIKYLMRHRHSTPFEMCEIKFHVKLPIFVARQWIRHRTANVNEYSARYSILDREFYVPAPEHLGSQSTDNRQGRGDVLEGEEAAQILREDSETCYAHYEELLNVREDGAVIDGTRQGLARELARMNLPLNYYTQWYWNYPYVRNSVSRTSLTGRRAVERDARRAACLSRRKHACSRFKASRSSTSRRARPAAHGAPTTATACRTR